MSKEEKEIKIELNIPLNVFLGRIKKLGFKKQKQITQSDNYFDTSDWKLYKSVSSLRIRKVDGKDHSFTFKKVFHIPNRDNFQYVEEIEDIFPILNDSNLKSIFNRLGMQSKDYNIKNGLELADIFKQHGYRGEQVLNKTRLAFLDDRNNEIVIDDVDNVGVIIELECQECNPLEIVKEILQDEEWNRSFKGTSYLWLEKVKGFDDHLDYQNKFKESADWNVWDNERDFYLTLS
ncbi:MAG: hypothetical protein PWQ10_299 [Patescibacteria group bacterium]|nr:hypothetical protein [Patescibacteria group bacterium]